MRLHPLFALALLAPTAVAQGVNCQLLATQNLHGSYANIWGYVAPNGNEYALLGATTGTAIVDCTIPTTPVERGFIPGASSPWRELNTYRQYCYVCTEAAGAGIQVIDLTNPNAPVLANTFGQAQFNNCHTITCDTQTGRIYCNGTNNGTAVFDASVTPISPTFVGYMTPAGQASYLHDLHTHNGRGYGSMIYNGLMRIYDLTVWPPVALGNVPTPGVFTHNAWTNANSTIVATTDEIAGGVVKFFDITNPAAPIARGSYTTNPSSIPHNAYIIGNYCHLSWYTEGYRCLDISDPSNPFEVASYDTWPGASGGFNGAWGCYPFLPSGIVLLSDIQTGLYIVRPQLTDLQIAHTALPDTTDETGPYVVRTVLSGSNPVQSVQLRYTVGGGAPVTVPMSPTGNPGEYSAAIPGQNAPVEVAYRILANDSVAGRTNPRNGDFRFFVGTRTRVFFDDFETDLGWVHGFVLTQDDWQRGTPVGASGTSGGVAWADPPAAYSGTNAYGNDLGLPGFNGAYQNNVQNFLQSPTFPTNGMQGLHLRFRRWITLHTGDSGRVLVNGTLVGGAVPNVRDTSWTLIDYDISAVSNSASSLFLRFELTTDATNVAGGWTIDDVEVYTETDCVPPVHYGSATAGSGGIVPTLGLVGTPHIGTAFSFSGQNMLGGQLAFLALGFAGASIPVAGITGLVDPAVVSLQFQVLGGGAGVPGAGTASWPMALPNNPSFDNTYLFTQVVIVDAGSAGGGGLAATDGMRIRVCRF